MQEVEEEEDKVVEEEEDENNDRGDVIVATGWALFAWLRAAKKCTQSERDVNTKAGLTEGSPKDSMKRFNEGSLIHITYQSSNSSYLANEIVLLFSAFLFFSYSLFPL